MASAQPRPAAAERDAGDNLRRAVASNPVWYHTIELASGVTTPGWFDLRPIVDRMPWPDVAGRRCLDVGTYDGFLAFELERRGAGEVVATDIASHESWDWPAAARAEGGRRLAELAGPEKGRGFAIARDALGSAVERIECSVYDLDPADVGRFDVVVCGSLLLHLRDPVRALERIRSVCEGGVLLSAEAIRLDLSILRRRPVAELSASSELCQWWLPNAAGHRRMVLAAGFAAERTARPYCVPLGPGHPEPSRTVGERLRRAARRIACGNDGVPTSALLARPRL